MAKQSKKRAKVYPSRAKVAYAAVPKEYAALLDGLGEDGAKYEGRSRAYLTKIAVRKFLQAEGLVDDKGKVIQGKEGG